MKVKFLKDHLNNKTGDVIEVTPERGNYFISVKAAVDTDEKAAVKKVVKKKPSKAKTTKPRVAKKK